MRGSIRQVLASLMVASGSITLVPVVVSPAAASTATCPSPAAATIHGKALRSATPVAPTTSCSPSHARVGPPGTPSPRGAVGRAALYSGGRPPLTFHGGPVMGTAQPGEVTITPIFWTPPGFSALSSTTIGLIHQFDGDLAADSALRTNVMSTLTDYTDAAGTHLSNVFHAATPILATDAIATSGVVAGETVVGCSPDSGVVVGAEGDQYSFSGCVTDVQIMAEIEAVRAQHSLPDDAAHLYPVFLPKGLQSCFGASNGGQGGSCSLNSSKTRSQYCAYHSSVEASGGAVYTVEPYPARSSSAGRCDLGLVTTGIPQAPNGDLAFDSAVSPYSHEVAEAVSDPFGSAWYDSVGNENGDECAYVVPATLGGTTGAAFDQTINGHHYLVQAEFSNVAFSWDATRACLVSAETPVPVISSLSASRLAIGEQLTIAGTDLGGAPVVRVGGQAATVVSGSPTEVVVTVPSGSLGGAVSVQTIAGTATAATSLSIVPRSAPAVTSSTTVAAVTLSPMTATITTTGYPVPSIAETGALPTGLSLVDNGDGTATMAGTPVAGTGGTWPVVVTAQSSEGTATSTVTIAVHEGPAVTSASTATFEAGQQGTFTITSAGTPTPTVSLSGTLPKGLTLTANQGGTATITGVVGKSHAGTYLVTVRAVNGVGPADVESLSVVVGKVPKVRAPLKVVVVRGATLSATVTATGSPTPTLTVLGLESWTHATNGSSGTVTITGRAPSAGASRYITLTLVGQNLLGTTSRTMFVRLR